MGTPFKKEKPLAIPEYIAEKLHILTKHFKLRLTVTEIQHMQSLTSEISVDNYAHTLLMKKL